jgi:hypothetical protein
MKAAQFQAKDNTVLLLAIPVVGFIVYFLWRFNSTLKGVDSLAGAVSRTTTDVIQGATDIVKGAGNVVSRTAASTATGLDNIFYPSSQLELKSDAEIAQVNAAIRAKTAQGIATNIDIVNSLSQESGNIPIVFSPSAFDPSTYSLGSYGLFLNPPSLSDYGLE